MPNIFHVTNSLHLFNYRCYKTDSYTDPFKVRESRGINDESLFNLVMPIHY